MTFHDILFPIEISYGAKAGPGWKTSVTELASGQTERVGHWQDPRHRYQASTGQQAYEQLRQLREFAIGREGALHSFRWKDEQDHATGATWKVVDGSSDVLLGVGTGSLFAFQCVKLYTSGVQTYTRLIKLPVSGTVQVEVDGVAKTEGVDYTVNYLTGIITFGTAPGNTLEVRAGFEFHVPVNFGEDVDDLLEATFLGFDAVTVHSVSVVEDFNPLNYADAFFYGGAAHHGTITTNIVLSGTAEGRVRTVNANAAGLKWFLPTDPENYPTGGAIWFLKNSNITNSIDIIAEDGSTVLFTLAADTSCAVLNAVDNVGAETWEVW